MFDEDRERLTKTTGNGLGFFDRPVIKRDAKLIPLGAKGVKRAKKKLAELPRKHSLNQGT